MKQTKFNYTNGDDFLLDGNSYVGFFSVYDDGSVYTGKYPSLSSVALEGMPKYSTDYYKSSSFKDRTPFEVDVLPYTSTEILIKPSEILHYQVLNNKLFMFEYNLQFMYGKMFVGDTNIPINDVYILSTYSGESSLGWEVMSTSPAKESAFDDLSSSVGYGLKKFIITTFSNNISGYCILGITDTSLIGLSSGSDINGVPSAMTMVLSTNVIDNNSDLLCENLEDISFDGKFLYISDSKINGGGQVFKYDIDSYITNDTIFGYDRFLLEPIGGFGGESRSDKFNGCTIVGSNETEVWIYDSGNTIIKVYDTNFVWKKNIALRDRASSVVLDIVYRKMNNHFYVLFGSKDETSYGMVEYNEAYKVVNTFAFEDILYSETDKRFKSISFSEQDSNVFYVLTEKTIHKKFFSKPSKSFSIFDRNRYLPYGQIDIVDGEDHNIIEFSDKYHLRDIFCVGDNYDSDKLFLLANGYMFKLIEKTDYVSVLSNTDITYFNFESIKYERNEYSQTLTFNKEFHKLASNILEFRNHLIGRIIFEFDVNGDLTNRKYTYLPQEFFEKIDDDFLYQVFIHDNELVQAGVINRVFRELFEIQNNLLEQTNASIINIKAVPGDNILKID